MGVGAGIPEEEVPQDLGRLGADKSGRCGENGGTTTALPNDTGLRSGGDRHIRRLLEASPESHATRHNPGTSAERSAAMGLKKVALEGKVRGHYRRDPGMGLRQDLGGAGNPETYGWAEYVRTRQRTYGSTSDGPGERAGERRSTDGSTLKKTGGRTKRIKDEYLGASEGGEMGDGAYMGAGLR